MWKQFLVPAARQKIIDTAQANGIRWTECLDWLKSDAGGPWNRQLGDDLDTSKNNLPSWYTTSSYHAYETGHLSWDAALEVELAGASVGARNMPHAGRRGETVWRSQFADAIVQAGGSIPPLGAVMVDVGCATGVSTRGLAAAYPEAEKIIGIDFSPYFIETGKRLLELAPSEDEWVVNIQQDDRIDLRFGNAAATGLRDNSVDVVSLQFVAHELPPGETIRIFREAHRILRDGGQLWFCEMDFQAPAYAAQRANPLLFSLLRATEPFVDEYADGQPVLWDSLRQIFDETVIRAATGRHFVAVSSKGKTSKGAVSDLRFDSHGDYAIEDTHLQVWENQTE